MMPVLKSALIWAGFLSVFFAWQSAQAKEFLICYEEHENPPYMMTTSTEMPAKNPGIIPEILINATKAVGLTPRFMRSPWKRCLRLLEQNKVDGIFASIYQKDREKIGRYPMVNDKEDTSRCLAKVDYALFTSTKQSMPWDGDFIGERRPVVGAPLGYVVVKILKNKHNIEAETGSLPTIGLKLVSINRMDAYVVEKNVGKSILIKTGLDKLVHPLDPPFVSYFLYFMISHKFYNESPEISEAIWDNIALERQTNFATLIDRYLAKIRP